MSKFLFATLISFAAVGVHAEGDAARSNTTGSSHSVTRAEVLADLEAYQSSGLQLVDRTESPDFGSRAYLAAKKRYDDLRSSPRFAQRVREYAAQTGELAEVAQGQDATKRQ